MLSEYKRYLLNIRNNMIRSGVGLGVEDVDGYSELFYLGENLNELLWFYTVLGISGSEDRLKNFLFPMNTFFMSRVRDKYFEDYLLYRAEYMRISASDAIHREQSGRLNEEDGSNAVEEEKVVLATIACEDEDGFIVYKTVEELNRDTSFEDDDDFENWGSFEDDSNTEDEDEEDEFENWGSSEDESSVDDVEDDEDEFENWGSSDNGEDDNYEEVIFENWGSSDSDGGEVETDDSQLEDDDDAFGSWGSPEDDEGIQEESSEDIKDNEYEDDAYGSWGSDDVYIEEESPEDLEDEEDIFGSWGSSEDDEDDESISDEEDIFGSWGDDTEEDEESDFGSWGSSSKSDYDLDDKHGSGVSIGESQNENVGKLGGKKTKFEKEVASNDKTARVIEKFATGVCSRGAAIKFKMSDKIKNGSR